MLRRPSGRIPFSPMAEAHPESTSPRTPALRPGENCWRRSEATKGAFLLNSRDYFLAFRRAVLRAEREVVILAWDISQEVELVRGRDDDGYPVGLADFLIAVLEEKPNLTIRILLWDYSVIYLAEREWLPFSRWRNPGHPRLELVTDNAINAGASHHQKLVVIDGSLAFCGGIDLCLWRWDSPDHQAEDPRRSNRRDRHYQPYHDLQVILTGPVVDDLRDLASMRWERATGSRLPDDKPPTDEPPWPGGVAVDFEDESLALALTFSRYEHYEASHHIERLYLEMIAAAERYLYIENQYLSSHTIVEALAERLREENGPEVVLVLTRSAGWAEEKTLGVLRDRLLEILEEADEHGRLSSCFPHAEDDDGHESQIYVHAKNLIADDRFLLTGSANLSNRSMKVDSELALACLHDQPRPFIRCLCHDLLAMHFQVDRNEVETAIDSAGSLREAIIRLRRSGGNRLRVLQGGCNLPLQRKLADSQLLDPDEPISPAHHFREALREHHEVEASTPASLNRWVKIAGWTTGLIVLGLAVSRLWASVIDQRRVTSLLEPLRDTPYALPLLTLVITVGGVIGLPLNLFIIGAAVTLGPWRAFGCGFVGAMIAAAISFGLGHHFGKPLARRLVGEKLETLTNTMARRGIGSVATLRLLPVAPFGIMNLVAGASGLRFSPFMIGSAIGLLPGIAAVTFAAGRFLAALENPSPTTWAVFGGSIALILGAAWWHRSRLSPS